jgi:glutaredoxin 3
MRNLTLYYNPSCPYCTKVIFFMDGNDIELPMKDISTDPQALRELTSIGGKNQVPCLFVDGIPMYESEDIIDFLKEEFAV